MTAVNRRSMLQALGLTGAGLLTTGGPIEASGAHGTSREISADVVIVGGSLGGCSAAIAALRNGLRVVMTEETDWIGGQLTSQGVPPDEHRWIETSGANTVVSRTTKSHPRLLSPQLSAD